MEPRVFLNRTVRQITGIRKVDGLKFGIELELEGRNVGLHDVATRGWARVYDGSLRGESIEYTTTGAKTYEETKASVDHLFKKFDDNKVKFNDSIRTSTHVHLNFSDQPMKNVINFFTLFTLLEEVLQYYSGVDRKGNLFCISTREAEGIVNIVSTCVARGDFSAFAGDRYKYAACNLSTLYKFGTVEVRTMRGATSAQQVNAWVDIMNDMYTYAVNKMESPAGLMRDLSHLGAVPLLNTIFSPDSVRELLREFPAPDTLHYSLMEGARILQVFAYNYEEDFLAKVEAQPDAEGEVLQKRNNISIWLPDGIPWQCFGEFPGEFWQDGERCRADRNIIWSQERQRFIVVFPDSIHECRWRRHPILGNEGPPPMGERRPMPDAAQDPIEEDFDDDEEHEDWAEDIEFDEGDEI